MSLELYWEQFVDNDTGKWKVGGVGPSGADLAALRAGLGRGVFTVPKMWPYYRSPINDDLARIGEATEFQRAEHAALALYGLHQQSRKTPMHRKDIGLGAALLQLRRREEQPKAVDRRVAALATSTSTTALLTRLRGLITQLRDIEQPIDYNRLVFDLTAWPRPDGRQRVRRAWAQGYQQWTQTPKNT